jgi:hypothetical protein
MLLTACLIVGAPAILAPQSIYEGESVFTDYLNPVGEASFMSIPGMSFNSSVGFSYMSSGDYGSDGFGYYLGHFSYRLRSDLTLNWDAGIRSSMVGPETGDSPQLFLPNFDLTYRPSERFMVRLQVHQYQRSLYNNRILR